MTSKMNKQSFLDVGYKEYPCPSHESDWCETFLQKRIKDDSGTMYFIYVRIPKSKMIVPTAKAQFHLSSATTSIELFHFESIDEMELFFKKMFIVTDAYYYEKY